jgi:LPXTG-site transpeptidase (sortase) family protein
MRKNKRAETIFGAILLTTGLVVLVAVILTLIVPPEIPDDFIRTDGPNGDEFVASPPLLVNQDHSAPAEQGLAHIESGSADDDLARTPRILPVDTGLSSELASENLPGNKQNDLLVAAIGQTGSEPEEAVISQPKRISIPALGIEAPIMAVGLSSQGEDEGQFLQWAVPNEYAVGWHQTSAPLRAPGNTVLNGHNNIHGAVFHNLVDLELGERLILYDDNQSYEYQVTQRVLFEEDGQSLKERHWNARWMLPTSDERLTIITCWPNSTNSHRLVVVAQPVDEVGT